jgi:hypothetical protein
MVTKASDIRWGTYNKYEGPWYPGVVKYVPPKNPSLEHQVISVITATEGGALDAINRYDSCIDTQGVIQWCNRASMFFVDSMYSLLDDRSLIPVQAIAGTRGYSFDRTIGHFRGKDGPVDNSSKQASMYFLGASGLKGTWKEDQKQFAKEWVAAAADVWKNPFAQEAQIMFTASRVSRYFITSPLASSILADAREKATPESLAFYCAYLSFAANNPKKAADSLKAAVDELAPKTKTFTIDWLVEVLRHLTFDPGIAIYPGRYNKIRPVLEMLYGVDLPDFAQELQTYRARFPARFSTEKDIQEYLIMLGYDLGPKGADGIFGPKSKRALRDFEVDHSLLDADGIPDWRTLALLETALEKHGVV